MAVKITRKMKGLNPRKRGNIIDVARQEYLIKAAIFLEEQIPKQMDKGKSPVRGGRWDKPYSDSYKKAIQRAEIPGKSVSPVNLRVSGQLHDSLRVQVLAKKLIVKFTDFLADIHNKQGAGKSKAIRRMLPTESGETWNATITRGLNKIANKTARLIANKFR